MVSPRFGQNLRGLRDRAGLSQRGFAKRLGYNHPSTVSAWEHGRLPTPPTIVKLARALGCSPGELLVGVVSPYEALRGAHELSGPAILLSAEEVRHVQGWRQIAPEDRAYVDTVLLPAMTAWRARTRRSVSARASRPKRRR